MTNSPPLGRGLGSLIPKKIDVPAESVPPPTPTVAPVTSEIPAPPTTTPHRALSGQRLFDVPIEKIDPNPNQPRQRVQDETLDELIQSIRQHGILQPLIVTQVGDRFQIIAGERRFRAAQRIGLPTVPALIRESRELEQLELAIVENVQRQDLNPLEEALAYQQLSEEFGLTQEDIAHKVGKRRTTVANALRMLTLPADMQQAIREGKLTASHAKILLAAVTPQERQQLFRQILDQNLPVRAAAHLGQRTTVRRHVRRGADPLIRAHEDQLRNRFGTKVKISKRGDRGAISIEFYSDEEFQQILGRLNQL